MFKEINRPVTVAIAALLIASIGYAGYGLLHQAAEPDPIQQLRETLDPNLFTGDVRKAYAAAQHSPGLFMQLPCFCGCALKQGHKSLYDCFCDMHAAKCDICIAEARLAADLGARGVPAQSIRPILVQRFKPHGS